MTTEPGTIHKASVLHVASQLPHDSRCQSCGAQAWVEVEFNTTDTREDGKEIMTRKGLDFCAHCYVKHEAKLLATAARIIDHRSALNALEGISDRR